MELPFIRPNSALKSQEFLEIPRDPNNPKGGTVEIIFGIYKEHNKAD